MRSLAAHAFLLCLSHLANAFVLPPTLASTCPRTSVCVMPGGGPGGADAEAEIALRKALERRRRALSEPRARILKVLPIVTFYCQYTDHGVWQCLPGAGLVQAKAQANNKGPGRNSEKSVPQPNFNMKSARALTYQDFCQKRAIQRTWETFGIDLPFDKVLDLDRHKFSKKYRTQ
jgi:hypothetical protein